MSADFLRRAARPLLVITLAGLGGCTNRYYFEDFRGKYVSPEIPTQFASPGEKGWLWSGGFAWGEEGRLMDFRRQDTLWSVNGGSGAYFDHPPDSYAAVSPAALLQERYRFERQPVSTDIDLTYLRAHWYAGLSLGAGIPDMRCSYLGIFAGYSQLLFGGHLIPTFGGGVFLNRIQVAGGYWYYESGLWPASNDQIGPNYSAPPPDEFRKDSVRSGITDAEWPFKMGLMYRLNNAFEPYVLTKVNFLTLWPDESEDPKRYSVNDGGLVLGIRNESFSGMALSLELFFDGTDGPLGNSTYGSSVAFRIQRRL